MRRVHHAGDGGLADFGFALRRNRFAFIVDRRASPVLPQCKRNFVPIITLLYMRGILLRQRTMQAVFGSVIVNPLPDVTLSAFRAGDIDGAAMAVATGTAAAAVQRVAGTCLVARSEPLAIIITKGAQHGPL